MTIKTVGTKPEEVKKKATKSRKKLIGRKPEKKKPLRSSGRGKALSKEGIIMALIPYFQIGLSIERAVDAHNSAVKKTLAKMSDWSVLNNDDTNKLWIVASQTVRGWYDNDEQVKYWVDGARDSMKVLARNVILKKLQANDGDIAKWVLETTEKDVFSKRVETTGKDWAPLLPPIMGVNIQIIQPPSYDRTIIDHQSIADIPEKLPEWQANKSQ